MNFEQMNDFDQAIRTTIRTLTLIFYAFLTGIILFSGVAYLNVRMSSEISNSELNDIFIYIVPVMGIFGLIGGKILYNSNIKQARLGQGKSKFEQYKSANLILFALLEGPCLFSIVSFLLTGNNYFLIMVGLLMLSFIMNKPSVEKCKREIF